jgi:cytochrome P450
MIETTADFPGMPFSRPNPFDPPERLGRLREHEPISRMRYPDGHVGWLVTGYELAREVLADPRFSSRNDLRRPVIALPVVDEDGARPLVPGAFVAMDPPEHTRYRRQLAGYFTVRRIRALEPRIRSVVDRHIDDLLRAGSPADLVATFARPVPAMVTCELLGVPDSYRPAFRTYSDILVQLDVSPARAQSARVEFLEFLGDLVRHKRARRGDDLLSDLISRGELADDELAGVAFLLLFAGHETTAAMIGLGIYTLLCHPQQLAAVRADPRRCDEATEELLRYLSVVQLGTVRGALEDVEVGGVRVRAGESVCVSLPAANRDPARFHDPDRLDVHRHATGHLAFGHGVHQCLGQQLARVEIHTCYERLLRRVPTLRLAGVPEDVRTGTDRIIYGVHELPVAWDG